MFKDARVKREVTAGKKADIRVNVEKTGT